MPVCGREFYIAFMRSKSWSIEAAERGQMPTNQSPHVLNRRHIRPISRPRKKLHALGRTEVSNRLCNMWACIILLKIAPGMP
ncbi:hypothetical protein TNCV_3770711 [Trichonephila clavipes]|nr:hypothetical protein TNCV_3770711 [Trichonephila clavipes]